MRTTKKTTTYRNVAIAVLIGAGLAAAPRPALATDATVKIHQATVQKFLSTLGTVDVAKDNQSKTIQYPYPGICWSWGIPYPCVKWGSCNATYSYKVSLSNLNASFVPSAIPFSAQGSAKASAGVCGLSVSASYAPAINGSMGATWNPAEQEIRLAMQHVNVEIYVSIIGYHVTITWVDVAGLVPNPLYTQKLELAKSFTLPAPVSKTMNVGLQGPNLTIQSAFLQFTTDFVFTATPVPGV